MPQTPNGKERILRPDGTIVDEFGQVLQKVDMTKSPDVVSKPQEGWGGTALKAAGGLIGSAVGGAAGTLAAPGPGTVLGGMAGSGTGTAIAGELYEALTGVKQNAANNAIYGGLTEGIGPAIRLGGKALSAGGGFLAGLAKGHPFAGARIGTHFGDEVTDLGNWIRQHWPSVMAGNAVKRANPKNVSKLPTTGKARVHTNKGGVADGPGLPAEVQVGPKVTKIPSNNPPNLEKVGRKEFTEVEKRAAMFGGAKPAGQAMKPNARVPLSTKEEADRLVQEILEGKTGGSLPFNAPRGTVLRKPK